MNQKIKQILKKIFPANFLHCMKICYLNHIMKKYKKKPINQEIYDIMPDGVNLIGDIRAEIGLGQSMRLLANELEHSHYPFGIYYFPMGGNVRSEDHTWDAKIKKEYPYKINLFHINQEAVGTAYLYLDKKIWQNHYNIAFWLWELEEFPKEHINAIRLFDEIWTPSEFASRSIRKVTDKPVITIPYHVTAEKSEKFNRQFFGLPEDKFLFLIMYDTNSTMDRKNPQGAVEAFKKAFSAKQTEVGLVIKMNNPLDKDVELIKEQLSGYDNVYFITEVLDKVQVNSLIADVDVFVSLHRAEGFGLVMAEAMLLDTVCIATNWSSNTEFMNSDVACMVDYKMVPVKTKDNIYPDGNMWADADIEQTAEYMCRLFKDKIYYETLKINARKYIDKKQNLTSVVMTMENRLREIGLQ